MDPKPCNYFWGGDCDLPAAPPFYDCDLHHAPPWLTGRVEVAADARWYGSRKEANEFPSELLASEVLTEDLINMAIERVDLGPTQWRSLATNPNLPLIHFEKVIDVKAVPVRAETLSHSDMAQVVELAAPVAWLTAFSDQEVPDVIWNQVEQVELLPAVGPLPATINPANVQLLSGIEGDPGFYHSVIASIQNKKLPLEYALKALGRIRRAKDVDVWDVEEATRVVAAYVRDVTGREMAERELFEAADRLIG
ncbi:MAG: hypothetical protein HKL82_11665 [Acidimicrobiaceae bacterium]|nr:hypothetical protein [Acidimicrobiaceae bacterium]